MTTEATEATEAHSWTRVLEQIASGGDLGERTTRLAMNQILQGAATPAQIAGFAVGLRMKGETVNELVGLTLAMLDASLPLDVPSDVVDIVGTGGSIARRTHALNVSTMASFVAAGAGAKVCKHGNYRASSTSGSFDFLTALGISVELDPDSIKRCVEEVGIGFAPARMFHPAMRFAAPVRAELGIATVFNILGPLAHPAQPTRQLIGTANESVASRMAEVFQRLGSELAWVVSGAGGLDEISTAGPSIIYVVTQQGVRRTEVDVTEMGIHPPSSPDQLAGGTAADNVAIFHRILDGSDTGPRHDIVVLNAGAALVVAGLTDSFPAAVELARQAIADGRVGNLVARLQAFTQSHTTPSE
jgi:anthranilate phosphoribosyltransferase